MFKTKIYNLWRQAFPKYQQTIDRYIPYFGHDGDSFPIEWARIISESPSAASCLSTRCDFVEGFGFSDEALEKLVINKKKETFWHVHHQTVKEYEQNFGFYWLVKYNSLGKVTEIEVLPFENCRLDLPDDNGYISKIFYNPFFGTPQYQSNRKKTKTYDVYNPDVVKKQMEEQGNKYKGQVLFYGSTSTMSRFYPINEAYAAVKWMKIEAGVSNYHEDNIDNGLMQAFILLMKGDPNAPSNNPEYADSKEPMTVGQEFDEVISNNFMGAKRVGNMWVQWVNSSEEKPEVIPIPSNSNDDVFVTLDNQATKKITVAWKVPGILANIQEGVSLGGDGNQIKVAVKLMQQRVVKRQRNLTDMYSQVLKLMAKPYIQDIDIVPYNPYPEVNQVNPLVWAALSREEQRKWIQDNTEIDLTDPNTDISTPGQILPTPPTNIKNAIPISFPPNVIKNVQTALDYMDKMQLKCGGKAGAEVSNMIVQNQNMGLKQLKRIYNFLKVRDTFANSPFEKNCEVVLYNAWGGKAMFDFLDSKLKEYDQWLNKTN